MREALRLGTKIKGIVKSQLGRLRAAGQWSRSWGQEWGASMAHLPELSEENPLLTA